MNQLNHYPTEQFLSTGQTFLIIAPADLWSKILDLAIELWGVSKFDTNHLEVDLLSIEEARNLRSESLKKPTNGQIRLCIIDHMDLVSPEVANTLLKVLEEPATQTRFLLFSQTTNILPTVLSRCQIWRSVHAILDDDLILPLDPSIDFGTVSLRIAEVVKLKQTSRLIDQWSKQLLQEPNPPVNLLRWLIEMRLLGISSQINQSLFLEYAWLAWHYNLPIPRSIEKEQFKHGHI